MTDFSAEEQSLSAQTSLVTDADEQYKNHLLEQFYLTLSVMYLSAPTVGPPAVHERVDRLFRSHHSWRNAYEIEQILCFVLNEQQIETELERRLAEAKALKLEHVDVIDKELHDDKKPPADKRIVLHRLLNDLQWFYSKRVQHRSASKRLMLRVSLLFMVALVTLVLVLFIQFFAHRPAASGNTVAASPAAQAGGDR